MNKLRVAMMIVLSLAINLRLAGANGIQTGTSSTGKVGAFADTASSNQIPAERQGPDFAVPYYTGKVYPTPQSAQYHDTFFSLVKTGIVLGKDIAPDDARVALLIERIKRCGGVAEILRTPQDPCDTLILIGDTGLHPELLEGKSVPDRPDGYLLHGARKDGKPVVFLKGKDFHGLLWGITSFNQLVTVKEGRTVLQLATIIDYPDFPGKLCYFASPDDDNATNAWFGVNVLRAGSLHYRQLRDKRYWRWRISDEKSFAAWRAKIQKIGAFLNPLRIPWNDSILPLSVVKTEDQVRSKSEVDIGLVVKAGMALAEAGGGLCILYDDFRFPLHPDDVRDFGTAREADVYFLNKVYAAVAAKYPSFKMTVCPPFYWGYGGADDVSTYGESRDEYLKAIGKGLPAAIISSGPDRGSSPARSRRRMCNGFPS